jgi:hypothetical protein
MTKLYKLTVFTIVLLGFNQIQAQTTIQDIISTDQTWTAANSPYLLDKNCIINAGATVTIEPGVTIVSSNKNVILVQGALIAEGTNDSIITFNNSRVEYMKGAAGYDFVNSTGSIFEYCLFIGLDDAGTKTITTNGVNLYVSNSKFLNCYYCIYASNFSNDTFLIKVARTIFTANKSAISPGYPIYASGSKTFVEIDECLIEKQCTIMIPQHAKITKSTFQNMGCNNSGIRIMNGSQSAPGNTFISCNLFKGFKSEVLYFFAFDVYSDLEISNNTFDSSKYFIRIYASSGADYSKKIIKNNNFLNSTDYDVHISGGSAPGKADTIDLTDNYWGTSDSAMVAASVYDFKDDITVSGFANLSTYLSGPETDCYEQILSNKNIYMQSTQMYPNPVMDYLNLEFKFEGLKNIYVYDMNGQVVKQFNTNYNFAKIDLSELNNGLYFIMVQHNGQMYNAGKITLNH